MNQSEKRYQTKKGFVLRKVAGMEVLISIGNNIANLNGYFQLNAAAAVIWNKLKSPSSIEEVADQLIEVFGISRDEALSDAEEYMMELLQNDMVQEI